MFFCLSDSHERIIMGRDNGFTDDNRAIISLAWGGGGKIGSPIHIRSGGACIKSVVLS